MICEAFYLSSYEAQCILMYLSRSEVQVPKYPEVHVGVWHHLSRDCVIASEPCTHPERLSTGVLYYPNDAINSNTANHRIILHLALM